MGVRNQNSCFLTTKGFLLKQRKSPAQLRTMSLPIVDFFENQPLRLGTYGPGLVEDCLLRCVNFAFR